MQSQNTENPEIHKNQRQNHEYHGNLIMQCQNHENQEIYGIHVQNHENHEKIIIPRQNNEIHEILEFDAGIMKFMKI